MISNVHDWYAEHQHVKDKEASSKKTFSHLLEDLCWIKEHQSSILTKIFLIKYQSWFLIDHLIICLLLTFFSIGSLVLLKQIRDTSLFHFLLRLFIRKSFQSVRWIYGFRLSRILWARFVLNRWSVTRYWWWWFVFSDLLELCANARVIWNHKEVQKDQGGNYQPCLNQKYFLHVHEVLRYVRKQQECFKAIKVEWQWVSLQ